MNITEILSALLSANSASDPLAALLPLLSKDAGGVPAPLAALLPLLLGGTAADDLPSLLGKSPEALLSALLGGENAASAAQTTERNKNESAAQTGEKQKSWAPALPAPLDPVARIADAEIVSSMDAYFRAPEHFPGRER